MQKNIISVAEATSVLDKGPCYTKYIKKNSGSRV